MTGKEAVLAAMNQQPTGRPVVTLITGGEWYFNYANQPFVDAKTSPEKICAVFEKAYRSIGHDMIWPGAGLRVTATISSPVEIMPTFGRR